MHSTWDREWGDRHWNGFGATPEAMDATQALLGEGTQIAASQAQAGGRTTLASQLKEWAPVVGAYVKQFQDPQRQVLLLQAKLTNARRAGASKATIRILEAKLESARRNAGQQLISRQQVGVVKSSAITATRVFTGVGVALIILILSRALRR